MTRNLSEEEIALINDIKAAAEKVGTMAEGLRKVDGLDQRWVSIGITDLQMGFMTLIRAVARPETF